MKNLSMEAVAIEPLSEAIGEVAKVGEAGLS
jgi:hypothetical protein